MLEIHDRIETHCHQPVHTTVILSHEQREKGRQRLTSESGEEIRVFLRRGKPLQIGELLKSLCGKYVRVEGAVEAVAYAECDDWQNFSRACYHLGNRHVKLQVGERWLRIKPDHVLEDMLQQLGLKVRHQQTVFVPESGAYSHGHHHH
ncbi:urease accessory protein UreE [Amphritea sp. HPY]|uniref:urease accessory protein UreE n=1 Tax=Amphritea sp. HPY TaxID=3421652 RepID=UPI003D7E7B18